MGTRHQDHDPLIPGQGQKVEYHTRHYYDGWDGVPDEFKGNGWVLINHTSHANAHYTDYSFQRLVEDTVSEERTNRRIEDRPTDAQKAQREAQAEQSARIEAAALRTQVEELKKLVPRQSTALTVPAEKPIAWAEPVMSIEALKARDEYNKSVIANFFVEGIHFGFPFPGSKDRMLYKAGAEWFGSAFGVRPNYTPLDEIVETGETPRVFYRYRCDLVSIRTGQVVGQAEGICSSEEKAYKYRSTNLTCPTCGKDTIRRGAQQYGGGWYCNKKDSGCGENFKAGDKAIEDQLGKKLNPEVLGEAHNILSKAIKRAYVLALRVAFGLDAYIKYYEDVDELSDFVINGTATVKDDVPEKVQKFNDQVKRENGNGAQQAPEVPPAPDPEPHPEPPEEPEHDPALDEIFWTRDTERVKNMIRAAGEYWKLAAGPNLYNRILKALELPERNVGKRDDLVAYIQQAYTRTDADARAAIKAYVVEEQAAAK